MSSPLAGFRSTLASAAVDALGLSSELAADVARQIRVPEAGRGDLALPCFALGRQAKKSPPEAAELVAKVVGEDPTWAQVEAAGPYVNVTFATEAIAPHVVPAARTPEYGRSDAGAGRAVTIDFSSPNIAKPLAFHHVRSTVIGAAIGRIHDAMGWKVVGINYLGDWGKQFGLLATGFARYGDTSKRADAKHLIEVYVKANAEADVDRVKQQIDAPEAATKAIDELIAARQTAATTEGKERKKAARRVKSLEKRLRQQRGLADDADPTEAPEDWIASLGEAAEAAKAELPTVQGRDTEARLFFKKLEDGDEAALAEWKEFRDTSIAEFRRVYDRMGIEFHAIEGESFYTDVLEKIVDQVGEKPGTKIDQGALIVDMPSEKGEPPVLLQTRDGTTLYITRDIAAAIDRHDRFDFGRNLYVVAADQSLHFSQLFRTLSAMGFEWSERCAHVPFGRVHGMSTRRGNVVFLDEVLDEAVSKARQICEASEKIDRSRLDETIEAVGVGAVVFGDLRNLRTSDYTFRWEDVVNFDGLTGPYVQYTHARLASIERKAGERGEGGSEPDWSCLENAAPILGRLGRFGEVIERGARQAEPSLVTGYLLGLCREVNSWIAGNRVLGEEPGITAGRLGLVRGAKTVIGNGLRLLGVAAPKEM